MDKKTLITPAGEMLPYRLPTGWEEVPLRDFLAHHKADNSRFTPAETLSFAVAGLTGLPTSLLFADEALTMEIAEQMPFIDTLPEPLPLPQFCFRGKVYALNGDFNIESPTFTHRQALSELMSFGNDLPRASCLILAMLYCEKGKPATLASIEATTRAFGGLPVSLGFGALQHFYATHAQLAGQVGTMRERRDEILIRLTEMEGQARLNAKAKGGFLRRMHARMLSDYLKRTYKKLTEDL